MSLIRDARLKGVTLTKNIAFPLKLLKLFMELNMVSGMAKKGDIPFRMLE